MPFLGTIHGKSKFSEDFSVERLVITWIILIQGRLSCGKIRGKLWLSADYHAKKHAFPQDNSQKVLNFRRSYCRKACLSAGYFEEILTFRRIIRRNFVLSKDYTAERNAFPQDNPWKVKTFCELSCRKSKSYFLKAYHYF
jgi:hypothetical protein